MTENKITKKVRDNKYEQILVAAADLFSTEGYAGTSFQKIADKVGLHKTTLFHYVKNKDELLLLVLEQTGENVKVGLAEIRHLDHLGPEEKLKLAIRNHLNLLWKNSHILAISSNQMKVLPKNRIARYIEKRNAYLKDFRAIILEMKAKGYFDNLDDKIVTLGVLGMLNWVPKWYKPGGRFTLEEVADTLYSMIVTERVYESRGKSKKSNILRLT
jgi:AcrR family transcriptional regulator